MNQQQHKWLRKKGYPHITPQINVNGHRQELLAKLRNQSFVARYTFYPLIHSSIKERKYKRVPENNHRAHSYQDSKGKHIKTAKDRPLHYATHMDALIFGYYSELLGKEYETKLKSLPDVDECVIAYRKIPSGIADKNKGTMHFAKDVFDQIDERCSQCEDACCTVLMFDIKSFFSNLDHTKLETAWADLIGKSELPADHKNVFNAATKFSYILLDELRLSDRKSGRKAGFDERKLHEIRESGKFAYFSSLKEFRDKIKSKELKLYRFPFWDRERNVPVGIPQGLPISATLANLYLLNFDIKIVDEIVKKYSGFYRRYSDDILIVCDSKDAEEIKTFVQREIENSYVKISKEKTEEYLFRHYQISSTKKRLTSIKIINENKSDNEENKRYACCQIGVPLTYLGFEYYGFQTLIKSANLSKFYRRMIRTVKTRASRAKKMKEKKPDTELAVFKNQLYKIYTLQDLTKTKIKIRSKKLEKQEVGTYVLKSNNARMPLKSNYLSYIKRVSGIMQEEKIKNQIRKHQQIFNDAIRKHLNTP